MKQSCTKPPPAASRLLRWATRGEDEFGILGDYQEEFLELCRLQGRSQALRWYWDQALRSAAPLMKTRFQWGVSMAAHQINTAFRRMGRSRGLSALHVLGLTLGLVCSLIILLYIRFETSYDRHHPDLERIYRIAAHWMSPQDDSWTVATSAPVARTLTEHYPQVEAAARILTLNSRLVRHGEMAFYETGAAIADNSLLDILHFPLIHGDKATALEKPNALVLSRSLAMKYFGRLDVLGETLMLNTREYEITGVMADTPRNTHLKLSMLLSIELLRQINYPMDAWFYSNMYTYVKLRPGASVTAFNGMLTNLARSHAPADAFDPGQEVHYALQPVRDIHLHSHCDSEVEPPVRPLTLILAGLIGGFVLLIAIINYINLATVLAMKRAREVGIRKSLGASRTQLTWQFLIDTAALCLLTFLLALVMLSTLLPQINYFSGLDLRPSQMAEPGFVLWLLGLFAFMMAAAGLYPARLISAFDPARSLKADFFSQPSGAGLRRLLVIGQFTLTAALISGTLIIHHQVQDMKHRPLGFKKSGQLVLRYRQSTRLQEETEAVKAEYLRHPGITAAAASNGVPGEGLNRWDTRLKGNDEFTFVLEYLDIDTDFMDLYGIGLLTGRGYNPDIRTDINQAMVLNETAVKRLGMTPDEALKHTLTLGDQAYRIIGVVRDFHQQGLQDEIEPLALVWRPESLTRLTLTVSTNDLPATLKHIRAVWERDNPIYPFEYHFLNDSFNRQYEAEERMGRLFTAITVMGLLVAALGLLGLSTFMAQRRTKEFGIRKVLGASMAQIIVLLCSEFWTWTLLANALAIPLVLWGGHLWLRSFAYGAGIPYWVFVITLGIGLGLTGVTVGLKALHTARENPVKSLKCE